MTPLEVAQQVKDILSGKPHDYTVTEAEARDIAYHYLRTHYAEKMRPAKITKESRNGKGEAVWLVELVDRASETFDVGL